MQEPIKPLKSGNFIHFEEFKLNYIKTTIYIHPDLINDFSKEYFEEDNPGLEFDLEEWWYDEEISLQKIYEEKKSQLPSTVSVNDLYISILRDRQIQYITVQVYYKTPNDKEEWLRGKEEEGELPRPKG